MKLRAINVFAILAITLIFCGCKIETTQKVWYDYGNGVVNLSNVSRIQSEMSFELKLKEKDENGSNKTVTLAEGAITTGNVAKVREGIKKYSGKWESVSYNAAIKFDAFTLKLHSFDTTGLECTDDGCIKLTELWLSEYTKLLNYLVSI